MTYSSNQINQIQKEIEKLDNPIQTKSNQTIKATAVAIGLTACAVAGGMVIVSSQTPKVDHSRNIAPCSTQSGGYFCKE